MAKIIDKAYMRDKSDNLHVGEALVLALLLHAKGKSRRNQRDLQKVESIMRGKNVQRRAKRSS